MNWIIFTIILILILSAFSGYRRGVVESIIGLFGFLVSLFLAFTYYENLGSFISLKWDFSSGISNFSAFIVILIIFEVLYSIIYLVIFKYIIKPKIEHKEIAKWDKVLGIIPGFASGWIFSSLLVLSILLLPINQDSKTQVKNNGLTKLMASSMSFLNENIKNLLIPAANSMQISLQNLNRNITPETNTLDFTFPDDLNLTYDVKSEQKMLELINQERKSAGLDILKTNQKLRDIARAHSLEMFRLSYFAHNSPISGTYIQRIQNAKVSYVAAGENIAYAPSVEISHDGLMKSKGHRANILSKNFTEVGIGIVAAENWGKMFTQDFIK
jgi:uncharacterized protein YkwD